MLRRPMATSTPEGKRACESRVSRCKTFFLDALVFIIKKLQACGEKGKREKEREREREIEREKGKRGVMKRRWISRSSVDPE